MHFIIKLFFLSIIITAELPGSIYKGNISGIVLDRESLEPVPGAVINILNTEIYLTSKSDGTFELQDLSEGIYKIKFTHLAYRENVIEIEISENSSKNIKVYLLSKSIEMNPVLVTDELHNSKFEEINEESNVLKGKDLHRELSHNLAATLKNETGLAIRSMGPAPARPVIRGLGSSRVHISEDGNTTTDLSATSPDHAVTLEPFTVDKIEIIRGPKILLHTSAALGGVVNIIRNEIPEEIQHAVHGYAGVFGESANNGFLGSIVTEIPLQPFSTRFELSKRRSSDLKTPAGKLNNSYSDNLNTSIGGSLFLGTGFIGASWRRYELTYGVPGGFVGAHPNGVRIEMFRDQYNIKSIFNFNSDLFDNIEMHYSRVLYRHKEFEYSGRLGSEFRIINHFGYLNLTHKNIAFFNDGIIGASFEIRDFNIGGYVFTPPAKSYTFSGYFFENFSFSSFSFEFGTRLNFDRIKPEKEKLSSKIGLIRERNFNTFSVSFSALYELSEVIYLGANVSKSSKVPSIEELYSEGPHLAAYSYETGNPELKAESGTGSEIFVYYKFDRLFFNFTFFRNDFSNYIIPRNTGEINYSTFLPVYSSSGVRALLYGFETQIDYRLNNRFLISASSGYTIGKFKENNNPLPQIPPFKGRVEIKYNYYNFILGLSSELASDQNKVDDFEEPTSGYIIFNSFIQYSLSTGSFVHNISLSADNIFNKEYRNHLSRVKSIMPEAGRNFRLTYRVYF